MSHFFEDEFVNLTVRTYTQVVHKHNIPKGPEGICTKLLLMKRLSEGGILHLFTSYNSFILHTFLNEFMYSFLYPVRSMKKTKQNTKTVGINKRKKRVRG